MYNVIEVFIASIFFFGGFIRMNEKIISFILISCASLAAVFFVIKQNMELAIFFLTVMFTLTNFFRSRNFAAQGYEKESKWMKKMAIFFAVLSLITLYVVLT